MSEKLSWKEMSGEGIVRGEMSGGDVRIPSRNGRTEIWSPYSYHCSRSSPLTCQRAKLINILKSCGNVTPTLRELHASPGKCQNAPFNDGPSPYKLISLLCFLTCYTLPISPIQTSSTIFISS